MLRDIHLRENVAAEQQRQAARAHRIAKLNDQFRAAEHDHRPELARIEQPKSREQSFARFIRD